MQIQKISVTGLFGIFDHVIPLSIDERITIVHGPNGFGKTAILRLLNGFFNSRYSVLRSIPFNRFRVEFDNGNSIEIIKYSNGSSKTNKEERIDIDFYEAGLKKENYALEKTKKTSDIDFPISDLEDIVPGLERIAVNRWLYVLTGEILTIEDVIDRFENVPFSKGKLQEEPEWLENLKGNIHVRLIESQRLLNFVPSRSSRRSYKIPLMLPTVSSYSEEIALLINAKLTEYGTISQSLERTFPVRVLQQQQQPSLDVTNEQLRHQLDELDETRSRLIEVGLLDKEENSDSQIQPQLIDGSTEIDGSTKNLLSVYVEDVEKKLRVFDEIASKIELLRRIINKKFSYSYKEMNCDPKKGFVFKTLYHPASSNQEMLSPTDLSSGEQHELVLLYELLFKVESNSLVLIDEPELSLHVGWQAQFLRDLQEITRLADLHILMATHSPDIIQDRWDLTVELKGPEK